MQTDISIDDTEGISGTLKYVTGYAGFSDDPAEQSGHFLAIHIECEGAEISVIVDGSETEARDAGGGIYVMRVDSTEQSVVTIADAGASGAIIREFPLDGLTLAEQV